MTNGELLSSVNLTSLQSCSICGEGQTGRICRHSLSACDEAHLHLADPPLSKVVCPSSDNCSHLFRMCTTFPILETLCNMFINIDLIRNFQNLTGAKKVYQYVSGVRSHILSYNLGMFCLNRWRGGSKFRAKCSFSSIQRAKFGAIDSCCHAIIGQMLNEIYEVWRKVQ